MVEVDTTSGLVSGVSFVLMKRLSSVPILSQKSCREKVLGASGIDAHINLARTDFSNDPHDDEVETLMNTVKTGMLLAALTALFGVVGYMLGGGTGMLIALGFGVATNVFAYWNSDRLALAAHHATEVDERTAPDLVRMVRDLARRADLPMPRVYLIDNPQPNAFATGRNPENCRRGGHDRPACTC